MFVSVSFLCNKLGVDSSIARFFVDRKVPTDNAFWQKKLLYIARSNGYISIPVYYDLLLRIGIPVNQLLAEEHVQLMERVMHFAILTEQEQLNFDDQLAEIKSMLSGRIKNKLFFDELIHYLEQSPVLPAGRLGMAVPSLNRADVFLFILCDLPLSEDQINRALRYWYALHTSFLLMDDIYDFDLDKQQNAESSIVELGNGTTGMTQAYSLLAANGRVLSEINPQAADYIHNTVVQLRDALAKN